MGTVPENGYSHYKPIASEAKGSLLFWYTSIPSLTFFTWGWPGQFVWVWLGLSTPTSFPIPVSCLFSSSGGSPSLPASVSILTQKLIRGIGVRLSGRGLA
jgi:hypothetical protein